MIGIANLLIVGDMGVGKTAFVNSGLFKREFEPVYTPTVDVNSGIKFGRFVIADFSGQENISEMSKSEYAGGNCAIVMCDFTSRKTLENASFWISRINDMCRPIPIVLCANKSDVISKDFTSEDLKSHYNVLCSKHPNLSGCFETSVLDKKGVFDVIYDFVFIRAEIF